MAKEKKFITCDGNEAAGTSGARTSQFRKCSQRLVQLVLFTVLCRLVH